MATETIIDWFQKQWSVVIVNEEGAGTKIGILKPLPSNGNNRVWFSGPKLVDAFRSAQEAGF